LISVFWLMYLLLPGQINETLGDVAAWVQMFSYHADPQTVLTLEDPDDILLLATGDVLLARSINARMVETNDFTFPFDRVAELLAQADITWVNLETPLMADCPIRYVGLVFCGDPRGVEGLHSAGVDVVNVANNHTENYGERGVIETEQVLRDANFAITGLFEPVILEVKGKKIGLLGFNDATPVYWISNARPRQVRAAVESARSQVDYLIVSFHWGIEYRLEQNNRQRDLAKLAIDAGADVVIGHHPHWVQGIEVYKDKPILYSLGNFIFDQGRGGWFNDGVIAVIAIRATGQIDVNLLPVVIEHKSTPRLATAEEASKILERMAVVSAILWD
jgi:poly-gamma-glutamate capsule biosynthesis protein CapA/YwtB (metallophosphatase superfamily)